MEKTKKCAFCGKELPVENFGKSTASIDGLYCYCKECARAKSRETYAKRRQQAKEVVTSAVRTINVELQRFTPRELIAELRSRGYVGELKYTQVIKV